MPFIVEIHNLTKKVLFCLKLTSYMQSNTENTTDCRISINIQTIKRTLEMLPSYRLSIHVVTHYRPTHLLNQTAANVTEYVRRFWKDRHPVLKSIIIESL